MCNCGPDPCTCQISEEFLGIWLFGQFLKLRKAWGKPSTMSLKSILCAVLHEYEVLGLLLLPVLFLYTWSKSSMCIPITKLGMHRTGLDSITGIRVSSLKPEFMVLNWTKIDCFLQLGVNYRPLPGGSTIFVSFSETLKWRDKLGPCVQ